MWRPETFNRPQYTENFIQASSDNSKTSPMDTDLLEQKEREKLTRQFLQAMLLHEHYLYVQGFYNLTAKGMPSGLKPPRDSLADIQERTKSHDRPSLAEQPAASKKIILGTKTKVELLIQGVMLKRLDLGESGAKSSFNTTK